ncbi:MAG: hypothetical protein A3G35_15175 [candidate division NC10 bacterium RIFCSPLOWO2_12_FULL_66_18]|nr:MAG: hypothetical protein A3H39_10500 [candidate division NC10 bacterium RIFCSPLOWO2_02_FULL_66_22]OGB98701.1 MAG: hypothetical protein A3G35_15175 [candidate division NC10 bacterium RIFCSPLOWO2_12_FULL_66_18]
MDFLRIWAVIRRNLWWILGLTLVVMVGTYLYARRLPKIYAATTRMMVPQRGGSSTGAFLPTGGRGDSLMGLAAASIGIQTAGTQDLFLAYLESRTMAEALADHFNLQERFRIKERQDAVNAAMGLGEFIPKKTGTIDIRVESPDPSFAADVANFYADNLDRMNRTFNITDAGRQRRFIEARLVETQRALHEAEEWVRQFDERNKSLIGSAAEGAAQDPSLQSMITFQSKIAEEEARLASLRVYETDENPEVILQRFRVEKLRKQLDEIKYGNSPPIASQRGGNSKSDRSFKVPVADLPVVVREGIRLRRDLKLQEAMFQVLSSQLEQAKIAEARDLPTLQILDRAIPPLRPVKPLVRKIIQYAGLLTFVGACLAAYGWDAIQRAKAQVAAQVATPA